MDCSWIKVILKWTTLFDDDFNEEELWEDVDSEEESSMENNEESGEDVDSEEKSSTENDKSTNITQLDRLEMDPLVARAYHNLNKSWLQQFPTEILLMIMEQLEDSDLLRLRRTSRIFLIHFGLRAFERCHQRSHNLRKELWQCSSTADAKRGSRPPDDILKEMYCTSCFTACSSRYAGGPTPEQDYFHCGGCGSDHQAQAFSATQIQKPPAERICIGREGRFKLCKHVSLGWSDVVKALESGNMMIAECSHRSHGFAPRDRHGNKNGQKVAIKLEKWNDSGHFLRLRSDTYVWLETQGRDRPTARQLRQRLEEIARISPIPWYPFDIPRLSPMRLVDPNSKTPATLLVK
ncbi:hypothetical protein PVAG01_08065 [Phlyctema vagabunda]|uniref:F-box domain-containing protein n=1 Tax=Phlyctema vagabunda TaxID=108571 RepID=A0ABR4P8C6_9HELO